jgi:hypothetical protein
MVAENDGGKWRRDGRQAAPISSPKTTRTDQPDRENAVAKSPLVRRETHVHRCVGRGGVIPRGDGLITR